MLILYINAGFVLLVGLLASHRAYSREPAKWLLLFCIGAGLWVLAYAVIDSVHTEPAALMAARLAFVGPSLAAPSIYYLARTVAFDIKPRPIEYVPLIVVSALFQMTPAVFTDLVLSGVSIDAAGHKTWSYGPLAFLTTSFWLATMLALLVAFYRGRSEISWSNGNRMLWITASLLGWLGVCIFSNLITLMLLKDPRFYYLGPSSLFLPCTIIGWSLAREQLPDFFGALGRLRPNSRSRFLEKLAEFERSISSFQTMDAAINRLSEIVGGRVSMAFNSVGPGDVAGTLWSEPSAWEKFYSPSDRVRWDRISKIVAQMDEVSAQSVSHASAITGWSKASHFEKPRESLWPLASMASLRVSSLVAQRVAEEPIVVLTGLSESSFVRKGIERAAGRSLICEDTYPDASDEGVDAGSRLRRRIREPKNTLLIVDVEVQICSLPYEKSLKELIDQGLKVVGLVYLEGNDVGNCRAFESHWLAEFDIPVVEIFPSDQYPEDVSAMIDVILLELDSMYGKRVRLSPEERESLLVRVSERETFPLVPLLEKIVLSRVTGQPVMPSA